MSLNVEEMKAWSRDECEARLCDVLPKLVEIITISESTDESLQISTLLDQIFTELLNAWKATNIRFVVLVASNLSDNQIYGLVAQIWSEAQNSQTNCVSPLILEACNDIILIGALELLCKSFLPVLSIESLESLVLCKLLPYVKDVFISISTSVKIQLSTMKTLAKKFEQLYSILDCLELCVNNCTIIAKQEIILEDINSLPILVLKITLKSFELYGKCKSVTLEKDSEKVLEQLDCLFNRTTSLTKSFLALWEKLKISVTQENDVQLTVEVCSLLMEMCRVFGEVAGKPPIALWKVYVSTLVKYCDGIKDRVDVSSTIKLLCENIQQNFEEITALVLQIDSLEKEHKMTIVRSIQICGFCLKIIMTLCEKYKFYLGDCFHSLLYLILKIYKFCPPSLHGPRFSTEMDKEVERNLVVVIEPLLSRLILEPQFISALKAENSKLNQESDVHFPMCLLQLFILEKAFHLSDKSQELIPSNDAASLFHSFFYAFSKCSIELSLPIYFAGIMCNGKPQRMVSFYEYVCTRFCGIVVALPASYFSLLERILVDQLLSGLLWNSLLICDVWTFLGRLESPQLCFHHCCCVAEMVSREIPAKFSNVFVPMILKRLFNLLATEHKMQFLNRYPLTHYHRVWCHLYSLPLWGNTYDVRHLEIVADKFLDDFNDFLSINSGGIPDVSRLSKMSLCLLSLDQIACSPQKISQEIRCKILNLCLLLWKFMPFHLLTKVDSEMTDFVAHLIALTGCLFQFMENQDLVQVQRRLLYFQSLDSHLINLAVYKMIHHLALKTVPSTAEQAHIFKCSASLLCSCLDNSNAILTQKGLETFTDFSCITRHEVVVAHCLQMKPQAKETVKLFLNQVPHTLPSKYCNLLSVLQAQAKILDSNAELRMVEDNQSICQPDSVQDNSKDENIAKEALGCLENSITRLAAAAEVLKPEIPNWLLARVRNSMDKLCDVFQM